MGGMQARSGERRWIILGDDGRHVSVGRATDPSEAELDAARTALEVQGLGGWLAVMEGDYYGRRRKLALLMVRRLTGQPGDWDAAVAAFEKVRKAYLAA